MTFLASLHFAWAAPIVLAGIAFHIGQGERYTLTALALYVFIMLAY